MAYTLQVLSLRCIAAQEAEGDEVYLMLNDKRIWSVGTNRMIEQPGDNVQISTYDFERGRQLSNDGWNAIPNFEPSEFVFKNQQSSVMLYLCEHDALLSDDILGEVAISETQTGDLEHEFTGEGSHYVMQYRVTVE